MRVLTFKLIFKHRDGYLALFFAFIIAWLIFECTYFKGLSLYKLTRLVLLYSRVILYVLRVILIDGH